MDLYKKRIKEFDFYRSKLFSDWKKNDTVVDSAWIKKNSQKVRRRWKKIGDLRLSFFFFFGNYYLQVLEFMHLLQKERTAKNEELEKMQTEEQQKKTKTLKNFSILPINSMHTVMIPFNEACLGRLETSKKIIELVGLQLKVIIVEWWFSFETDWLEKTWCWQSTW